MFGGGSTAKGPRDTAVEEQKSAATKPVFRGKAKLNTGAATTAEEATTVNYDFSKMKLSSATATGVKKEGEDRTRKDGERRGPPRKAAANDFSDDDGFEVVKEKKKEPRARRQYEEPSFGGGKPMFTRGGGNRDK